MAEEFAPTWWRQMQVSANLKQLDEDKRQRQALVEWIAAIDARQVKLNDENEAHLTAIEDQMFADDQVTK